jgi:puromycin-sensitive aminopeptidase
MAKNQAVLLPPGIKPERYRITIRPDFSSFTFSGEETIYFINDKPREEIVLHSNGLEIKDVFLKVGGEILPAKSLKRKKETETVSFLFSKKIPKGRIELRLSFSGRLSDDLRGFYRSRYSVAGEERYLAVTQFESTDARRAFPCFDEPAAKAIFDVTMIVPANHTAISNTMPVSVAEHEAGYNIVRFAPTPKMSTYLLAFISGEFESVEAKTAEGVLVRVFTTAGKKKQAEFALQVAKKSLSFYSRYFGIAYPLPVMDLIAVPDFAAGAMENWGAVTYRESAILVDPDHTSAEARQWVALVIAHELAHQWFGNLVTMNWWTDLWLNEGFASYIEYLAIDHIFPDWKIWNQFVSRELGNALRLDALKTSHPIEAPVGHPNEISEVFDAVSYSKGAAVIRMLAEYLGEKDFRDGLRYYLKTHSYGNARTADLWRAFEKISKKPVAEIMSAWTKKTGYPLISVSESGSALLLSQSRFFSNAVSRRGVSDRTIWSVPLTFSRAGGKDSKILINRKMTKINKLAKYDWLKLNLAETGIVRVDYPAAMLKNLAEAVSAKKLSAIDRLGIVRDVFALAESGQSPTTLGLSLAGAYKNETEYVVWLELSAALRRIRALLSTEPCFEKYQAFGRSIFSAIVKKVGWQKKPGEPFSAALFRDMVIFQLGLHDHKLTLNEASRIFGNYLEKNRPVDKDIRNAVYFLAARNGGRRLFKKIITLYKKADLADERDRLGEALGFFNDPKLLAEALRFSLSKNVRPQDAVSILRVVADNRAGKSLAWRFVRDNWQTYLKLFGAGGHVLPKIIQTQSGLRTVKEARELKSFFKKHGAPGAEMAVSQAVERILGNALWLKRDGKKIADWLSSRFD